MVIMSSKHLNAQYNLRWPDELKEKIAQSAKEHNRSMNADIVARLEESFTETIPASGLSKIIAAYFMGLHSRYISEREQLTELLRKTPADEDLQKRIFGYDILISQADENIKRLMADK